MKTQTQEQTQTQSRRKALGRGLEELFNNEPMNYETIEEKIITSTPKEEIVELNLSELRSNPYQPRKNFDEKALQELANSIKEYGVFQPIIAKKSIKGYEIIAGERRVKASILAGKETIPAILRDFSDQEMMEIALLENLQRENLNALEEALAYKKLIEENLEAKIVLQVHDEMMIEAPLAEAEKVKEIVKTEMESAIKLNVPLIAEVSEAENWYECK